MNDRNAEWETKPLNDSTMVPYKNVEDFINIRINLNFLALKANLERVSLRGIDHGEAEQLANCLATNNPQEWQNDYLKKICDEFWKLYAEKCDELRWQIEIKGIPWVRDFCQTPCLTQLLRYSEACWRSDKC